MRERTSADRSRDGGGVVIWLVVAVMLAFAVILSEPPIVLFALFLAYTLSGPLLALRRMLGRSRGGGEQPPAEQG